MMKWSFILEYCSPLFLEWCNKVLESLLQDLEDMNISLLCYNNLQKFSSPAAGEQE